MAAYKVYFDRRTWSPAIHRIIRVLNQYKPDRMEVAKNWKSADLIVVHVNGRLHRTENQIEWLIDHGKRYAVIQYSLKSTRNKSTAEWMPIWEGAEMVWSYLTLNNEIKKDGGKKLDNFYSTPLGVDTTTFRKMDREREYTVLATGYNYLSQSAREVIFATRAVGGSVAYLGPDLNKGNVDYYTNISDHALAALYSKTKYVSGLRRVEGFEMPAAEGLICGAHPILFDRPDHTKWYDGLATFIPETSRDQIIQDLKPILQNDPVVTQEQIDEAKHRFDWEKIIGGFWSGL